MLKRLSAVLLLGFGLVAFNPATPSARAPLAAAWSSAASHRGEAPAPAPMDEDAPSEDEADPFLPPALPSLAAQPSVPFVHEHLARIPVPPSYPPLYPPDGTRA